MCVCDVVCVVCVCVWCVCVCSVCVCGVCVCGVCVCVCVCGRVQYLQNSLSHQYRVGSCKPGTIPWVGGTCRSGCAEIYLIC